MSLLGILRRFGSRLCNRRVSRYGGNENNTSESKPEPAPNNNPPEFGLAFIADRADQHTFPDSEIEFIDQLEPPNPRLTAKDVPFAPEVRFCDDEPGGWIIADEKIVINWEDF